MEKISRHKYEKDFTVVNNQFLRDKNISWKAKGIICYTTMLPDNWVLNMNDLKNRSTDGRDSLMSGIQELIKEGYCKRTRTRGDDGQISGIEYEIADFKAFEPQTENPVIVEPQTGNPDTVNPETGNPPIIKTNKKQSTKGDKKNNPPQTLFPDMDSETKKLFSKTVFSNFTIFENQFKDPFFKTVDLRFYYDSVSDWSDAKTVKRTERGWIATARSFMRSDAKQNKLRFLKTVEQIEKTNSEIMDYFKGFD